MVGFKLGRSVERLQFLREAIVEDPKTRNTYNSSLSSNQFKYRRYRINPKKVFMLRNIL